MSCLLNLSYMSSSTIHSLIEALHDDVDEGVPRSLQMLEACRLELGKRDTSVRTASPVLHQKPSGWELIPFQWYSLRCPLFRSFNAPIIGPQKDGLKP